MILERFYDEKLAQASYLVGCEATGEALVVDPNRDVEPYVERAARHGLRIAHVTETHIHADFVSGVRELAARTGARVYLSGEGTAEWQYGFTAADGATVVHDGDVFSVGRLRIQAMHTPGHTPEHLCFILTDSVAADLPMGVFTGDFVFVGDVGRPDLLERAARIAGTMEAGAKQLYASLQHFAGLADYLQVWPGHGAGSACGKALGAVPQTTVGYEKMFNWAFRGLSEERFVQEVLTGQPTPPRYFADMKRINREGPRVLGGLPDPAQLPPTSLAEALAAGAFVVDTRAAGEFARAHVPGCINIPLNRAFTTWAGWLIPYDRDFYLIAPHAGAGVREAARDLALIGLDRIAGFFESAAIEAWHGSLGTIGGIAPEELERRDDVAVVDVRTPEEWRAGHLPGVPNIPLGELEARLDEIPRDRPVVLHCQGGGRAAIAASVLAARGFDTVLNLESGYVGWRSRDLPVESGDAAEQPA